MPRGNIPRQPSKAGRHDKVTTKRFAVDPITPRPPKRTPAPAQSQPARPAAKPAQSNAAKALKKSAYNPLAPARIAAILRDLDDRYPKVKCALHHHSDWELLVATILSAQCTDARVNMVTPIIFKKYPTPEAFAALKPEELEPDIRSTGFFRNKAKSIVGAAK